MSVVSYCYTYCQLKAEVGCTVPPVSSMEVGKPCGQGASSLSTEHEMGKELHSYPKCENIEKE